MVTGNNSIDQAQAQELNPNPNQASDQNQDQTNTQAQEPAPEPEPEPSFDEKLAEVRTNFDAAEVARERAAGGVDEVKVSIANAESRLSTLRDNLSSKEQTAETARQAAITASQAVEALHREYQQGLA